MEALIAISVGITFACGVYLMLRQRTYPVILGLAMFSYGANLLLFSSGGLVFGGSPILTDERLVRPDVMPQALVLTAIVIGFAMTAYLVVLALQAQEETGTDHVDGKEENE